MVEFLGGNGGLGCWGCWKAEDEEAAPRTDPGGPFTFIFRPTETKKTPQLSLTIQTMNTIKTWGLTKILIINSTKM